MKNWFNRNYPGSVWNNETEQKYGYGQEHRNTVEHVRNHFGLWKTQDGCEVSNAWVPYSLGLPDNKRSLGVYVYNFRPNLFFQDDKGHTFIRFRLSVKLRWDDTKQVFTDKELIIEFPADWPTSPPAFFCKDYVQYGTSHDHHTWEGGRLCILTEAKDWHGGDTIVSAINVALNRVVSHYQKSAV